MSAASDEPRTQLRMLDDGRVILSLLVAADAVQHLPDAHSGGVATTASVHLQRPTATPFTAPAPSARTRNECAPSFSLTRSTAPAQPSAHDKGDAHEAPPSRTEAEIVKLSTLVLVLAFAAVTAMLIALGTVGHRTWLGWVGVVCASLIFSTTTIPMKLPSLAATENDPMLFALFTGVGICIVSVPILIYLVASGLFAFQWWPALGAVFVFSIGYFALNAVALLGVAVASACWSGIGMLAAFLFGAIGFREPIASLSSAGIAIAMLMCGVYCVSSSKSAADGESEGPLQSAAVGGDAAPAPDSPPVAKPMSAVVKGLLFCLANGLADGSLMVPFKMVHAVELHDSLNYLASFGVHAVVLSPVLYVAYIAATGRAYPTRDQVRVALFPGLGSGVLWACANLMSVNGTFFLGMAISFPLTQTCALLSALWGVVYFGERIGRPVRFCAGIVGVIAGSYFLSASRS